MTDYEKAIEYVRKNKTWTEEEDAIALEVINNDRCSIDFASPRIFNEIHDLMEEYGEDNGLEEGWWYEFGNEDDVFFEL